MTHQSVLLKEAIEALAIKADGIYIDGTFGRGGHSLAILAELKATGRLIAMDKDQAAICHAETHFSTDPRFFIAQGSFKNIAVLAREAGVYGRVNGILLDLGVSSPQLDTPSRGFSFMCDGPLDMRMDLEQPLDARRFINEADLTHMTKVFREYGEERFAGRIARAIISAREKAPILTTAVLAEIIKEANPKWEKHKHPATRVFQAIRIYVNQELVDLSACLEQCVAALARGGRLVVISFHSLEDRIVKQFMREAALGPRPPSCVPLKAEAFHPAFKRIGKALKPQEEEIRHNPRARSAVLRIGEKIV